MYVYSASKRVPIEETDLTHVFSAAWIANYPFWSPSRTEHFNKIKDASCLTTQLESDILAVRGHV
jgi:hypothetical protein